MRIAVDGPAASGKGTLGKRIAAYFGLNHLDTGLLYRAVARDVQARGKALTDVEAAVRAAKSLDHTTLADPALRGRTAGESASIIARIPEVRAALLQYQRQFAARPPGAALDGRDIGTVVLPDADVKIFVTASSEERARRRWRELNEAGADVKFSQIHEDIRIRDRRDRDRAVAPLVAAPDAILLDTTELDIEAAFRAAVHLIEEKTGKSGRTP